uniref:Sec-independent protein translocase component tatA/E n=1 Tax=Reclinomonas americana ATCC 50284 TaxID=1295595 RepID=M4QAV8_RECAM|nr:Sec-independent protein translocase component tatA/E [Reclinomonas americana ATCC 50284]
MSVGIGQILVVLLLVVLLFGKFPNLSKNLTDGLTNIRNVLEQKKEIASDNIKKKEDIDNTEKK